MRLQVGSCTNDHRDTPAWTLRREDTAHRRLRLLDRGEGPLRRAGILLRTTRRDVEDLSRLCLRSLDTKQTCRSKYKTHYSPRNWLLASSVHLCTPLLCSDDGTCTPNSTTAQALCRGRWTSGSDPGMKYDAEWSKRRQTWRAPKRYCRSSVMLDLTNLVRLCHGRQGKGHCIAVDCDFCWSRQLLGSDRMPEGRSSA